MRNVLIVVLSITTLFLGGVLVYLVSSGGKNEIAQTTPPPDDNPNNPELSVKIEKSPVEIEDVERVQSRTLKGEFCTTGRGEDAQWGIARTMNFQYTAFVIAESEILNKKTLPNGYVRVEEKRTFKNVSDSLCVSDVDFQLRLDTLPVKQFSQMVDAAAALYVGLTGDLVSAGTIVSQNRYWQGMLKTVDGKSLRSLLGLGGIEVPEAIETYLEKFSNAQIRRAMGGVRSISGKEYHFNWIQNKAGSPMYVHFTYPDGTEVTEEEERLILKRVNTFIDSHIAPNPECKPGDSWEVSAECLQEVFDPYVDGTYTGAMTFKRSDDDENGLWNMTIQPGKLEIRNDQNAVTGRVTVQNGYAKVSPKETRLEEMFVEGKAMLQKLTSHHWLFTARIEGECTFQGRILSTPPGETGAESTSESLDVSDLAM